MQHGFGYFDRVGGTGRGKVGSIRKNFCENNCTTEKNKILLDNKLDRALKGVAFNSLLQIFWLEAESKVLCCSWKEASILCEKST